jgi:hypothetical protein|tara:strand:- start:259 stop:843 length:585 start_codon:yes stop_codon:yes gene_type:complete
MKESIFESNGPSFISGWFIDESTCDQVLDFYSEENYFPIRRGVSSSRTIDYEIKDSFDKTISNLTDDIRILNYFESLSSVVNLYCEKFPWCSATESWSIVEHVNIQRYLPGGGYKIYHTERTGKLSSMNRHLAFMTYLNDVTDAGETEFYHQKLKVKPQKGLTLIWPVDWTHTHRGIPSPTQEKTIITGWYSFK